MELGQVLAFWGVSALFVITPGADWAHAITSGTRYASPLPGIAGMLAGHLVATIIVAAGAGALIAGVPFALTTFTILGALYLLWIGTGTLRHSNTPHTAGTNDSGQVDSWSVQVWKGFGVSGLNPKVFLLFLALLPQFTVAKGMWPVGIQMLSLGAVHLATCAVVYLMVGYGAQRILRSRPTALKLVSIASGVAMILIGALIIIENVVTNVRT